MNRKDEACCQQRLVGMNYGCYIEHPAGQETAEKFRKPEHHPRTADSEHPPENSEEIEFFPVGPSVKGGFGTFEEKPSEHSCYIIYVFPVRTKGIGPEQSLKPVPRYILSDEKEMQAHENGGKKVDESNDGACPVEKGGDLRAADDVHKAPCPLLVAEFQRQAGQGQPQKAHNNQYVQDDMAGIEAAVLFESIGHDVSQSSLCQYRRLFPVFYKAPEHPEKRMHPEYREGACQQPRHTDESPVKEGELFPVRMFPVGVIFCKQRRGVFMALPAS